MVAVPTPTPVISPFDTVATLVLLLVQVISGTLAVIVELAPIFKVRDVWDKDMLVTFFHLL